MAEGATAPERTGFGGLMAAMALFVVVGTPLVYVLWSVVNDILTGHIVTTRLILAVPALILFIIVLNLLARAVRRWDASVG